jgi:imidazoleglycerol-phosphate dehydratase
MKTRIATVARTTGETSITVTLLLDGGGRADVDTGVPFLDHLLVSLARHARFDLDLRCTGDLAVDDHHTVEDCALAIGAALREALGDVQGIARFGHAYAPLDEALARAVVDVSGRAFAFVDLGLRRERLGSLSTEMIPHALRSLASAAGLTVHVELLRGDNDHHRAEAAFKALALALRAAVARPMDGGGDRGGVPSTKGMLEGFAS